MIERNAACHSLLQHLLYEQRQAQLFKRICKANKGVSNFQQRTGSSSKAKAHAIHTMSNKIT